jgi:hypothetical protein
MFCGMKKLIKLWKSTIVKYVDVNDNGKLDLFEILIIIGVIIVYNLTFELLGNYLYDILK